MKLCKSMDWFLYDRDVRHERVKHRSNETRNELAIYVEKLQYFTERVATFCRQQLASLIQVQVKIKNVQKFKIKLFK